MYVYTVYGLVLSSNQSLSPLHQVLPQSADVEIVFRMTEEPMPRAGATLVHSLPYVNQAGESQLQIWKLAPGDGYWLRSNIGEAWAESHLAEDGRRVEVMQRANTPLPDLLPPLYGLALPLVLRLHGVTCLHASAVLVDGRVFAFTGPSETGKSTMLTALMQTGGEFFSDDLVPMHVQDGRIYTYRGFPQVGLWPDSAAEVLGREVELPHLWQESPSRPDKRIYRPRAGDTISAALPLGGVYLLSPRTKTPEATLKISPVAGHEAVAQLLPNTTGRSVATQADLAEDLKVIAQLVRTASVRRVERRDDLRQVERVAGAIMADMKQCVG